MFFQLFHRNWVKTTGRVLDSRIRTMVGKSYRPVYNYVVEFVAPTGQTARFEVKAPYGVVKVYVGNEMPLLVRPDGKKAVVDKMHPSINATAVDRANRKAEKERFRKNIEGQALRTTMGGPGQPVTDAGRR